jgi:heme exporter protein C
MKPIDKLLLILVGIMMPIALYFAFIYAPREMVMGEVQRIFYFHLASAWTGLLSFFFVFVGGAFYLWSKKPKYDYFAHSAVELGILYLTIVLITGPIWAKPVWGAWWTWDPRLTSTFVLWLIFMAYTLFRSSLKDHPAVRTYASVYGIIGFIDVPIVYMSIYWWRTIHPKVITPEKVALDPKMWTAVLVCFATMLVFYTILIRLRMDLLRLEETKEALRESLQERRV